MILPLFITICIVAGILYNVINVKDENKVTTYEYTDTPVPIKSINIINTDIVTVFPTAMNRSDYNDIREKQVYDGAWSFISTGINVPIIWYDNTTDIIPSSISNLYPFKHVYDKQNNGVNNFGAGSIQCWNSTKHIFKKYKWLIHFEPRQLLTNPEILHTFLHDRKNTFAYHKSDYMYTGIFIIETKYMLQFLDEVKLLHYQDIEMVMAKWIDTNIHNDEIRIYKDIELDIVRKAKNMDYRVGLV